MTGPEVIFSIRKGLVYTYPSKKYPAPEIRS
jgi:hypothetical protein